MQGLPTHPSLPLPPHLRYNTAPNNNISLAYHQPPIQFQPNPNVSSHYAQAYMQYNPAGPSIQTSAEGHSFSSVHSNGFQNIGSGFQSGFSQATSRWHEPGSCRCTKQACSFSGSQKAVETHMMDRHLIYPPGWEARKRKSDWDADPSLKGKPVPIQGTNIKLDSPETIEQWIAERKKRFPTVNRVVEKKQKIEEAVSRGQLFLEDPRFPKNKRRRLDGDGTGNINTRGSRGRGRGTGRGRGQGGGRGRGTDSGYGGRLAENAESPKPSGEDVTQPLTVVERSPKAHIADDAEVFSDGDSDSDDSPEVVSSRVQPTILEQDTAEPKIDTQKALPDSSKGPLAGGAVRKSLPKQPKRPPQNPFASRPALLRNLLLPEIQMTVSNLSQAISFLVGNDFLDNVELRAGQGSEKMIEVIAESNSTEASESQSQVVES